MSWTFGWFQFLVTSKAIMNILMCVFWWTGTVSLSIHLWVELLHYRIHTHTHIHTLCFRRFSGFSFPKLLYQLLFCQQDMRLSVIPHSHQHLVLSVVNFSHSRECVVISHCGFHLHFSGDQVSQRGNCVLLHIFKLLPLRSWFIESPAVGPRHLDLFLRYPTNDSDAMAPLG